MLCFIIRLICLYALTFSQKASLWEKPARMKENKKKNRWILKAKRRERTKKNCKNIKFVERKT